MMVQGHGKALTGLGSYSLSPLSLPKLKDNILHGAPSSDCSRSLSETYSCSYPNETVYSIKKKEILLRMLKKGIILIMMPPLLLLVKKNKKIIISHSANGG